MRTRIKRKSAAEMRAEYPLSGQVTDWYFRCTETSSNAWRVEGSDVWGRKVVRQGGDPEALLAECIEYARSLVNK